MTVNLRVRKSAVHNILALILIVLLAIACGKKQEESSPPAQEESRPPLTATFSEEMGEVLVMQVGEEDFSPLSNGLVLQVMGQVQTRAESKVRLDISDGSIVRLGPNSHFTFEGEKEQDGGIVTSLKLLAGNLYVILGGGSLEVDTPSGVASVRGSYMEVRIDPESGEIIITCLEGNCGASTEGGEIDLVAGQSAVISQEDLPPEYRDMSEEDILAWIQNNPEATAVLVPLTATVAAFQTDTPTPAGTNTPTPTGTREPTNTPTQVIAPEVIFTKDVVCTTGPGGQYDPVKTIHSGTTANVVGQSEGYWVVEAPGSPGVLCWVPKGAASANGAAGDVPDIPPPPEPTNTEKPTKEPKEKKFCSGPGEIEVEPGVCDCDYQNGWFFDEGVGGCVQEGA